MRMFDVRPYLIIIKSDGAEAIFKLEQHSDSIVDLWEPPIFLYLSTWLRRAEFSPPKQYDILKFNLPGANPAPERSGVPCAHVQVHVPSRDTHIDIFHVNKSVKLYFPIMTRVTSASTAEPNRTEHCLVIYLVLFIGSQTVVEQLYVRALVVEVPGERFLTKEDQLSAVRDF